MTKTELKRQIEEHSSSIATLLDELRVKIHLAGMDAKTMFAELERRAAHLPRDVSESTHRSIADLRARLEKLAHSIADKLDRPGTTV